MLIAPLLALLAAAFPATGTADTTRYHLTATLTSAITPESGPSPQEQVVQVKGWLQLSLPVGAGTIRAVIDSGSWTTTGFAMLHEVSTDALRGMELRASVDAAGAPTSRITGGGEHAIASVFQEILGFVRGAPVAARTDSLVIPEDGARWRLHRAVRWSSRGNAWEGTVTSTMLAPEPDTSAGTEGGTVTMRLAPDGSLDGATIEVTRDMTIASEHGAVLVRQTILGTLTRLP